MLAFTVNVDIIFYRYVAEFHVKLIQTDHTIIRWDLRTTSRTSTPPCSLMLETLRRGNFLQGQGIKSVHFSGGSRGGLGGSQPPIGIQFFQFFLFNSNSTVHPFTVSPPPVGAELDPPLHFTWCHGNRRATCTCLRKRWQNSWPVNWTIIILHTTWSIGLIRWPLCMTCGSITAYLCVIFHTFNYRNIEETPYKIK